jgi:SAM-dependent methyltransferase
VATVRSLSPVDEAAAPHPLADRDRKLSEARRAFWETLARDPRELGRAKAYYDKHLFALVRANVPAGRRVLEIGCGTGDLLAALEPSEGVGLDFSTDMIARARERHPEPNLRFEVGDAADLPALGPFEYVVLSNLVGDLVDVERTLRGLSRVCDHKTRIVLTYYNYLWQPIVRAAEILGLKPRVREQNWLRLADLESLLDLAGIETVKRGRRMLLPFEIPLVSDVANRFLDALPGLEPFCLTEYVVARRSDARPKRPLLVSVVVPTKDERGNIEEIVRTVPKMGAGTELIFVDGHSTDGTLEEIERCKTMNPALDRVIVLTQDGKGKGDAVRKGFAAARGDVLMILDADITVRSEDLPKFYDALVGGKGEFINGSRLVYPMEDEAMRFLNLLANHFFGGLFSWLVDQRLTDTLCGTKVLFREDYERIVRDRSYFGDFDPFGDFDLLFGAARLGLKIREVPIRYRNREYGEIKIERFKHGLLLLRMAAVGWRKLKAL